MGQARKSGAPYDLLPRHESPPLGVVEKTDYTPRTMADHVMMYAPASDSEALKLLRASFQDAPLSQRVAALNFLMRKKRR